MITPKQPFQTSSFLNTLELSLLILFLASLLLSTAGIGLFLWLLFFIFLYHLAQNPKATISIIPKNYLIPFAGFGITLFLSHMIHSQNFIFSEYIDVLWRFRFTAATLFLSYFLIKHWQKFQKISTYLLPILVALLGIYGLVQTIFRIDIVRNTFDHMHPYGEFFRATGFFKIPLTFAYVLSMLTLFVFCLGLKTQSTKHKMIYFFVTFVGTLGVFATWTRGAWLALGISMLFLSFLHSKKLFLKMIVIGFLFLTSLTLIPEVKQRLVSITNLTNYSSNTERIQLWQTSFEIIKHNPILGVGWLQAYDKESLKKYYDTLNTAHLIQYDHSHNDFLEIAKRLGLLGLFFYLWFSVGFLLQTYFLIQKNKLHHPFLFASLGAQLVFHIGSFTQCNFLDMEVYHVLILCWAVTLVFAYRERTS